MILPKASPTALPMACEFGPAARIGVINSVNQVQARRTSPITGASTGRKGANAATITPPSGFNAAHTAEAAPFKPPHRPDNTLPNDCIPGRTAAAAADKPDFRPSHKPFTKPLIGPQYFHTSAPTTSSAAVIQPMPGIPRRAIPTLRSPINNGPASARPVVTAAAPIRDNQPPIQPNARIVLSARSALTPNMRSSMAPRPTP